MLREEARFELMVEKAVSEIAKLPPLRIPKPIVVENNNTKEGLLIFADCHYDKELEIKSLSGEIMNKYDTEIFEDRMWQLLDETVAYCKENNFKEITIANLGDELEGMLRISILMSIKYGITESGIRFAYFISRWLNKLSENLKIKYCSTSGNHTDLRIISGKKGDFPNENISKFILALTKSELKNNPNIEFIENATDKIYINIAGYDILGIHGEEKSSQQAIRDYNFIYPENIDYIIAGHRHHSNVSNLGFKRGWIGVGSIIGIDDFSMTLKRISDPSATFVTFQKNKGKVDEHTFILN